jgi:ATP-binding cassette, subfamily B, bacterial
VSSVLGRLFPSRSHPLVRWGTVAVLQRWKALLPVVATMLGGVVVTLLKPWPMKLVVDHVLTGERLPAPLTAFLGLASIEETPRMVLSLLVAATIALFLVGWALDLGHAVARVSFSQRIVYDLSKHLFDHLQRVSLTFHSRHPIGDTIRRISADTGFISTLVQGALLPALGAVLTLVGMTTIMWQLNPQMTLVALAAVPLMATGFLLYSRLMVERSYQQQAAEATVYNVVEETFSSIATVQSYTAEESNDRRLRSATGRALDAAVASAGIDLRFKIAIGMATAAGSVAVLWFGAHEVLSGRLTVGSLLVFLAYLTSFYTPVNAIMYSSSTVKSATGSARRVAEMLRIDREVQEKPGARVLTSVRGRLEFRNVYFGYTADRDVLQDVSITLEAGETLAVVGGTGAGKSTLLALIPRFFDPQSGSVLLDGCDLRDLSVASVRSAISIVQQEPLLFPMSLADNIAYGRPGASRAEVVQCARAANAHDFILDLPDGYETVLGERGCTLSGGERQRVSIARALLKDAPILLLDEPTSALDAATEADVIEALERLMRGRTTLIIAHRLSTARNADRIVVLEGGRVVEEGSYADLLVRPAGNFRRYHNLAAGLLTVQQMDSLVED